MKIKHFKQLYLITLAALIIISTGCSTSQTAVPTPADNMRSINILVDDFKSQPYEGQSIYYFNRLEGDRGALNNSEVAWGNGQVTTTISSGNSWGGLWMSLNHPARENRSINFSAVLPSQILPEYQAQVTNILVQIVRGTPGKNFRIEFKDNNDLQWQKEIVLSGELQEVRFELPALGNVSQIVLVLDQASEGDFVTIGSISLSAKTPITDTATAAFVWSYGMLLENWNPATGLVRDKAKDPSGSFDAIQSTGSLAAATAIAEQLGVVDHAGATQIVNRISETLLNEIPRYHGLLPHWVRESNGDYVIVENTEWSSVDTVIAALGLLGAQNGLGLDTSKTELLIQEIDWQSLLLESGISHGYTYSGDLIPYAWDAFGGESWLVELAYASATGQVAPIAYPSPPTANGSGFIDDLAWIFVSPPSKPDHWETNWASYRETAADHQISYYPSLDSDECFSSLGLFGLSAGEVPDPALVSQNNIYQAYGVGGAFAPVNNGSALGAYVVTPHYSAMIASLRAEEAVKMWQWMIDNGIFSPLNNVESLMFPAGGNCDPSTIEWNQLKGSWNLSLQTLSWGRYLAERNGEIPVLWQATTENHFLGNGYLVLVPETP